MRGCSAMTVWGIALVMFGCSGLSTRPQTSFAVEVTRVDQQPREAYRGPIEVFLANVQPQKPFVQLAHLRVIGNSADTTASLIDALKSRASSLGAHAIMAVTVTTKKAQETGWQGFEPVDYDVDVNVVQAVAVAYREGPPVKPAETVKPVESGVKTGISCQADTLRVVHAGSEKPEDARRMCELAKAAGRPGSDPEELTWSAGGVRCACRLAK